MSISSWAGRQHDDRLLVEEQSRYQSTRPLHFEPQIRRQLGGVGTVYNRMAMSGVTGLATTPPDSIRCRPMLHGFE